jgi:hypothetical protein
MIDKDPLPLNFRERGWVRGFALRKNYPENSPPSAEVVQ